MLTVRKLGKFFVERIQAHEGCEAREISDAKIVGFDSLMLGDDGCDLLVACFLELVVLFLVLTGVISSRSYPRSSHTLWLICCSVGGVFVTVSVRMVSSFSLRYGMPALNQSGAET